LIEECLHSIFRQDFRDYEVVLVDNDPESTFPEKYLTILDNPLVRYFHSPENLGVAGGRNKGMELAKGEYWVFIDDDAEFADRDTLGKVHELMREHPRVGILAFKSLFPSGEVRLLELPGYQKSLEKSKHPYRTHSFIGVAHAFRSKMIREIGPYPSYFMYSSEEIDLSLRAMHKGYEILYHPCLRVIHKKSPKGRITNEERTKTITLNKIRLAIRNLPLIFVISHILLWTLKLLYRSRGNPRPLLEVARTLLTEYPFLSNQRSPISFRTCFRVFQLGGSVFY
jgi:GT2 family glycosyltransferase